jgi:hypothetical protein
VADFRAPTSGLLELLQKAYYLPPLFLFHLVTATPLHPLYDYRAIARRCAGVQSELSSALARTAVLPLFESITFGVR